MRIRLALITTTLAFAALAGTAGAETKTFTQENDVTFQDLGYASPLPSVIPVSGMKGTVTKLDLFFDDFTSDQPNNIDTLLVGPSGATLTPISDAGGALPVGNVDFAFADGASPFSQAGPLTSGTFRPTDYDPNEPMGMGSPAPPYGTTLAGFNGTDANGNWRLFAFSDFFDGDSDGALNRWRLVITTEPPVLDITAKRQKLKGKVKLVATSTVNAKLVLDGGVKTTTVDLAAGQATPLKAKIKPRLRKALAENLDEGKSAKVKLRGVATDVTGATGTDKTKVKLKG